MTDDSMPLFQRPITDDPWYLHFHAIGMITVSWTTIETRLDQLIVSLSSLYPNATADLILSKLGNVTKADLVVTLAKAREWEPEGIDALEHFVKGFNICRENRNIIMHARWSEAEDGSAVMAKISASGAMRTFSSDITALRRVAQDMDILNWYIEQISLVGPRREPFWRSLREHVSKFDDPTPDWPQKHPLPRKLDPLPVK